MYTHFNIRLYFPLLQDGELSCGDKSCIERGLFCNGEKNCPDGSDENSCGSYDLIITITRNELPVKSQVVNFKLANNN